MLQVSWRVLLQSHLNLHRLQLHRLLQYLLLIRLLRRRWLWHSLLPRHCRQVLRYLVSVAAIIVTLFHGIAILTSPRVHH